MKLTVINKDLYVGNVRVISVSRSSLIHAGDSQMLQLYSLYDSSKETLSGPKPVLLPPAHQFGSS
ncbi:spore gernimation protein GerPD [Paenibacillus sp. J22TS3]|uniref:spore gernimation protein GerPD n=1 Tax=Paenibacillus sp. J22TS3 TaxID=2807192 RepID=UPI001B0D2261|nr:spore gernimation protein GerPD [Paenibacillus sp. J22TS3]GIP19863.1 hypothetical protein J22TS3_01380 [Paenibacillus sp. J22TS3]